MAGQFALMRVGGQQLPEAVIPPAERVAGNLQPARFAAGTGVAVTHKEYEHMHFTDIIFSTMTVVNPRTITTTLSGKLGRIFGSASSAFANYSPDPLKAFELKDPLRDPLGTGFENEVLIFWPSGDLRSPSKMIRDARAIGPSGSYAPIARAPIPPGPRKYDFAGLFSSTPPSPRFEFTGLSPSWAIAAGHTNLGIPDPVYTKFTDAIAAATTAEEKIAALREYEASVNGANQFGNIPLRFAPELFGTRPDLFKTWMLKPENAELDASGLLDRLITLMGQEATWMIPQVTADNQAAIKHYLETGERT